MRFRVRQGAVAKRPIGVCDKGRGEGRREELRWALAARAKSAPGGWAEREARGRPRAEKLQQGVLTAWPERPRVVRLRGWILHLSPAHDAEWQATLPKRVAE